jgi:hypothetical protein
MNGRCVSAGRSPRVPSLLDAGVIGDARARQHRQRVAAALVAGAAIVAAAITIGVAALTRGASALRRQALRSQLDSIPGGERTSAGLAIGNVAYYFTGWKSTAEALGVSGCLGSSYRNEPRWPETRNPVQLASWVDSPHR